MNCLEFESQLELLARGALLEARTRSAAEAHAGSCDTCAARLADERTLSTGLRALASGMKGAEASAGVEAALLASFHARAASVAAADLKEAGAASNVVPLSAQTSARQWSWVKTVAVASLAAAASLAFFILVRQGASPNTPHEFAAAGPQQQKMIEPPPSDNGSGHPSESATATLKQPGVEEGASTSPEPNAGRSGNAPRTFTPRARIVNASYTGGGRGATTARPAGETNAQEVATEFIPLMQAGPYAQAEDGHLVRVELPRSALASFGLPINAEAASDRVKADVLLGQDGIARAIRFIR